MLLSDTESFRRSYKKLPKFIQKKAGRIQDMRVVCRGHSVKRKDNDGDTIYCRLLQFKIVIAIQRS